MKLLLNFISWAIVQGILALICTLTYDYLLVDLFKVEISYIQWLGIMVISTCVFPSGKSNNSQDQDATSKFNDFVNSIYKKKNDR